jgi:hypothetical protein
MYGPLSICHSDIVTLSSLEYENIPKHGNTNQSEVSKALASCTWRDSSTAPIHDDTNTPTKNMNTNEVTNPSPATVTDLI